MCNRDWRIVYKDDHRRPGYVIENGKPPIKLQASKSPESSVRTYLENSPICNEFLKKRGSL